jgi:hypothetical protein
VVDLRDACSRVRVMSSTGGTVHAQTAAAHRAVVIAHEKAAQALRRHDPRAAARQAARAVELRALLAT